MVTSFTTYTNRLSNWEVLVGLVGQFSSDVRLSLQVHEADIVEPGWVGERPHADGIILKPGQFGGVKTADCLPLVLVTSEQALVLHVSRKTLIKGLLDKVPDFINPSDITGVFIGPHICDKHFVFETEGPELTEFKQKFPEAYQTIGSNSNARIHLNVRQAVQQYLDRWHVHPDIVIEDKRCNYEMLELPSYRKWLETDHSQPRDHIVTAVRKASI